MNRSRPLVLISHPLPDGWIDQLEETCELLIGPPGTQGLSAELLNALPEASALLTTLTDPIAEEILLNAPNLKIISNMAVGVDNIDLIACTKHHIPVGHTPGVLTEACADHTMALMLALARRLPESIMDAKEGKWSLWSPTGWLGADLHQATLGIVGMGKIGQAVAHRARAFGMNIIYHSRSANPEIEADLGATRVSFQSLLQQSDFITLHVPLSAETKHLINADAFSQMKPDSYLINMARGPVVDTEALLHALETSLIKGAALDVIRTPNRSHQLIPYTRFQIV